jgi:hypothetical protein
MGDTMEKTKVVSWEELLREAVEKPGLIHDAYGAFHDYSLGNQIAAAWQCHSRDVLVGPLDTFKGWQEKGRCVRRGEKAIWLCVPYTIRLKSTGTEHSSVGRACEVEENDAETIMGFDWKPRWFTLHQTEAAGETETQNDNDSFSCEAPELFYNNNLALENLLIEEIPFDLMNGNVMGYARGRQIAVSLLAPQPQKTRFHEMAHVLLGHTEKAVCSDDEQTPRNLREVEAEGVAYLCCESLQLPGAEYSRGYIQHWLGADEIPEASARKIFSVANRILKAGKEIDTEETR